MESLVYWKTIYNFADMDSEDRISVVINTYNASEHLAEALEAVKDFDEIVVCDMESTDNTLDIARRYGCKIVSFPKANHKSAEPARTFAIQSASFSWVLVVDADEIISPKLREYLYGRIRQPGCPAGLYVPRINKFMGMYIRDFNPDYQLRFFIKEGTVWPPYVHTFPKVNGPTERIKEKVYMYHLMDETMSQNIAKMNEYTDNEVEKKAKKGYGFFALCWRPAWRFVKSYLLSGGFRMGKRGLVRAMLAAVYQFVLVSKIIERRYRSM